MSEYPKFLCRPGTTELCLGVMIDWTTASDADDEAAKRESGWSLSPLDFEGASSGDPFLDQPAASIIPALPAATIDELRAWRAAELAGKTRKGVIAALDNELAHRDNPEAVQ